MKTLLSLALLAIPASAAAADADVCYSAASAGMAAPLTSSTLLSCPRAENHTLPELAAAGWTIVAVQPVINGIAPPSHPGTAWMIVIEKKQ